MSAARRRDPDPCSGTAGWSPSCGGRSGERLDAVCDSLLGSGVRCLEITMNTPGALAAVRRLAGAAQPGVEVGVGTVRGPEQVDAAADAGATFIVAPNTSPAVGERAAQLGLGYYPGAFTATEVLAAWELGATAVKVFPASVAGPRVPEGMRGPIDHVPLLPTGGVTVESVPGLPGGGRDRGRHGRPAGR